MKNDRGQVNFRCTKEEVAVYREAAKRAGFMSVCEWIRYSLRDAARRDLK